MDKIRKMHTGEPGNPGQFGKQPRTADEIALASPTIRDHLTSTASPLVTVAGIAGVGAGIALFTTTATGLLPAAIVLASAVAIGTGAAIGIRKQEITSLVAPGAPARGRAEAYVDAARLAPVIDIQSKAIRRERANEFDKADMFAREFSG